MDLQHLREILHRRRASVGTLVFVWYIFSWWKMLSRNNNFECLPYYHWFFMNDYLWLKCSNAVIIILCVFDASQKTLHVVSSATVVIILWCNYALFVFLVRTPNLTLCILLFFVFCRISRASNFCSLLNHLSRFRISCFMFVSSNEHSSLFLAALWGMLFLILFYNIFWNIFHIFSTNLPYLTISGSDLLMIMMSFFYILRVSLAIKWCLMSFLIMFSWYYIDSRYAISWYDIPGMILVILILDRWLVRCNCLSLD